MKLLKKIKKLKYGLSEMFKWKEGRQKTGYRVMKLFQTTWPRPMDAYLIHYPKGSYIDIHTDPVLGFEHWRCNITLKRPLDRSGLSFQHGKYNSRRLSIFRSDYPHRVYKSVIGDRLVLSFGYCKKITTE